MILIVLLRALIARCSWSQPWSSPTWPRWASSVIFTKLFGFAGTDPSFPLLAFLFLVALGVDYNIFLMARVREETPRHGTREGMLRGLAVTGGVITSAGIVLAGTFLVLGVLPLVALTEIGFVVALGVLIDTTLVRSVLVPALVLDLGAPNLVAVAASTGAGRGNRVAAVERQGGRIRTLGLRFWRPSL